MKNFFKYNFFLFTLALSEPNQFRVTDKINLEITGFTEFDMAIDSRQSATYRADIILLYPLPKDPSKCGIKGDINAKGQTLMSSIFSRINFKATGPDIGNAKVYAILESDFLGLSESTTLLARLRHAYANLDYNGHSFLFGTTWNPLTPFDCYPNTVAPYNGLPIDAVSRNPQIRYTYNKNENFQILFAALEQNIDFSSYGPIGFTPEYLREAIVPNLHLQFRKFFCKNSVFGMGIDYKRLVPRRQSEKHCKVDESINSFSALAYTTIKTDLSRFCFKVIYAQNGTDHVLLGGYGVSNIDPITDQRKYTNLNAFSIWGDFEHTCNNFRPGIFAGYAKNLGASDKLERDLKTKEFITYTLPFAEKLDDMFRVSPRLRWTKNSFELGGELEITHATFGNLQSSGKVDCKVPVTNYRIFFTAHYFF